MERCDICEKIVNEDDLLLCEDCDRSCCEDCVATEYRNFSYYSGNVDVVNVCGVCRGLYSSEVIW